MKDVADTALKFGSGLLGRARASYSQLPPDILALLPRFPEHAVHNGHGVIGFVSETHFFVAKSYPFGEVVSIHKKFWDACVASGRMIVMYINSSDSFYEFDPSEITDHKDNMRGDVEMTNFSIRHGINIVKMAQAKADEGKETLEQKCDRYIATLRPEFGNIRHIHLLENITKRKMLRGRKNQNKKEIRDLEEHIIKEIESYSKHENTSL